MSPCANSERRDAESFGDLRFRKRSPWYVVRNRRFGDHVNSPNGRLARVAFEVSVDRISTLNVFCQ